MDSSAIADCAEFIVTAKVTDERDQEPQPTTVERRQSNEQPEDQRETAVLNL
jgi:hypothetical protein